MTKTELSLENFLLYPSETSPKEFSLSEESISIMLSLLSRRCDLTLSRMKRFMRLGESFVKSGVLSKAPLTVEPSLKPRAYMRDGDGIYISAGLILTRSPWVMLSVYLHEIAHLYLSEMEWYGNLKQVQREFFERYDKSTHERMSPIEIFAETITVSLLSALLSVCEGKRQKRRLSSVLERRKEKLSQLIEKIKSLEK